MLKKIEPGFLSIIIERIFFIKEKTISFLDMFYRIVEELR